MKIITLILNWLIVCVCCLASEIAPGVVTNHVQYDVFSGKALPSITTFCINTLWILWAVPLAWGIVTILFFIRKTTHEKNHLHTSMSVFLGLLIFFTYTVAGIMPFLSIITYMGH